MSWADEPVEQNATSTGGENSMYEANVEKFLFHQEIKSFEELNVREDIIKGIYSMGYNRPSNIQGKTLPIILKDKDNLIAQSQSGTGKTAAFAIGMLTYADKNLHEPQVICVCPSYELGMQILERVKKLGVYTGLSIGQALKGSTSITSKVTDQIIVATPGSLIALIYKKLLSTQHVKLFVIDEADQMLETNFKNDLMKIRAKLNKQCRFLLFSATFAEGAFKTATAGAEPSEEEIEEEKKAKEKAVISFAKDVVPAPYKLLLLPKEELTLENMKQFWVDCKDKRGKQNLLKEIYEQLTVGQSIIFFNSIKETDEVCNFLNKQGMKAVKLTGEMQPHERKSVIEEFREGKAKVLLSTNVISRGLDIDTITHVLNYDLPFPVRKGHIQTTDYATYLHRIGRTARYGRKGIAINFVGGERDMKTIQDYKNYFKKDIAQVKIEAVAEDMQ